jgi:hypothetical protein
VVDRAVAACQIVLVYGWAVRYTSGIDNLTRRTAKYTYLERITDRLDGSAKDMTIGTLL